ncbi:hypothetical protein MMC13_002243 [Lambiella insularis]|nr:hypothetical protein [Lambiella insularis]
MARAFDSILAEHLSAALPKGIRFTVHHLSSAPTNCSAIFSPIPGHASEETSCESHFLSVSVKTDGSQVQAFALEVLIYTTRSLTTLFVSKADSTGYLRHMKLPSGTPSPLRTVISIFLALLVEYKRTKGIRLVLSLFARAQDQYLFPGSIENSDKHVLDDRGLIKWWCRIIDLVLQACPAAKTPANVYLGQDQENNAFTSHGYLRVPGCDDYETKSFFPSRPKRDSSNTIRWFPFDPLRALGKPPGIPERCLVPRFPDDPKARFVIDLDDELPESCSSVQESPSKCQPPGKWRSVKSLEQFWEMMAFRQECAAGRLVGFIWGVFTPVELVNRPFDAIKEDNEIAVLNEVLEPSLPTPLNSQTQDHTLLPPQSPVSMPSPPLELPLSPLASSQVQPSEPQSALQDDLMLENNPDESDVPSRQVADLVTADGTHQTAASVASGLVLSEAAYTRIVSRLQELDYASLSLATESTRQWLDTAATETGDQWAFEVNGSKVVLPPSDPVAKNNSTPTILGEELIRKEKRSGPDLDRGPEGTKQDIGVSVLGAGLVRKKPKVQA